MPHYRRNFLSSVIFRVDFDAIPALRSDTQPDFSDRIHDLYPRVTGVPSGNLSISLGPSGANIEQKVLGHVWEHRLADPNRMLPKVVLSAEHLAIEYGKGDYDHFLAFQQQAERMIRSFVDLYAPAFVRRIGLRYINEIVLEQGDALDWNGLIKPELVTSVRAAIPHNAHLARSLHQLQAFNDDLTLLFHYGISNPDFPNQAVRRHFVLDIDCFRAGQVASAEIAPTLASLNEMCEQVFEDSIEDGLRQLMGVN